MFFCPCGNCDGAATSCEDVDADIMVLREKMKSTRMEMSKLVACRDVLQRARLAGLKADYKAFKADLERREAMPAMAVALRVPGLDPTHVQPEYAAIRPLPQRSHHRSGPRRATAS